MVRRRRRVLSNGFPDSTIRSKRVSCCTHNKKAPPIFNYEIGPKSSSYEDYVGAAFSRPKVKHWFLTVTLLHVLGAAS